MNLIKGEIHHEWNNNTNRESETAALSEEEAARDLQQALDALSWKIEDSAPDYVKMFLLEYYPGGLVYLHNSFLAYKDGYWVAQVDHGDVQKSLAKFFGPGVEMKEVREAFLVLRLVCSVKDEEFKPNNNYVCFLNGALHMETFDLVDHDPVCRWVRAPLEMFKLF